ncbi:cobalamin-dependent protein [Candidatus Fermentibacteria bacterium]|nr:cobalamin-dependent protein [Candidatus Fermentibacteria bacterium]
MSSVLLVFPETHYKNGQVPLGLGYCAGALEARGHDVAILDLVHTQRPLTELRRLLRRRQFDIVGLSVVTTHLTPASYVSRIVRQAAPKALIVWGGAHPTVMPAETAAKPEVDIAVAGEGEEVLPALADDPSRRDLPGLTFRQGDTLISTGPPLPIADLDSLPFPARHLVPMESYLRYWYSLDAVSPKMRGTGIMASRGCPYRCSFCQPTLSMLFGTRIRKRSPGNIVHELEQLRDTYSIEGFMFEDSTFVLDRKWVLAVCDALRPLNMLWCCNIRADLVDEELLAQMTAAGLRKVNIGIESGVQRILDEAYQKQITRQDVDRVVSLCRKLGIKVQGYFILGVPIETREDMHETIRYAVGLDIDDAVFDIATPFPQTHMYNKWSAHVTADFADFDCFQKCVFRNLHGVSPGWIERQKKLAYYRFYLHPRRWAYTSRMVMTPTGLGRTLMKARRV